MSEKMNPDPPGYQVIKAILPLRDPKPARDPERKRASARA